MGKRSLQLAGGSRTCPQRIALPTGKAPSRTGGRTPAAVVGSLLIEKVAAVAAEQDCGEIRLDVIDTNPRARSLYERRDLTAIRTERTPYLRELLGFGAVTTMRRPVEANRPRGLSTSRSPPICSSTP